MISTDYLIVGAGSAGCVLADRLSAADDAKVLLLEAGRADARDIPEVQVPMLFPRMFGSDIDWGFETVPQSGLGGRTVPFPRGKGLGGSSLINAQLWTRGHRADYDGWAEAGCDGWDYDSVRPYFDRAEAERIRLTGIRYPSPVTPDFVTACAALGYPEAADQPDGYTFATATHHEGLRWSSAAAYLDPARRRTNLTVLTEHTVRRILFDGTRAIGVEVETARGVERILADREVILAAGSVGSPQLLMVSGVGPVEHLARHGIPVVADLPAVGQGMSDHLLVPLAFAGSAFSSPGVGAESADIARYLDDRTGPLDSIVSEALVFVRTRPELAAPDIEIVLLLLPYGEHETTAEHGLALGVLLLRPESRGSITLRSADPRDAPRIDPGFLSDAADADLRTTIAGVRKAQEIVGEPVFGKWCDEPLTPGALSDDDGELTGYIRRTGLSLFHPVGTCRMGADAESVVDTRCRVRGVSGLRVIDASALPSLVRGHTHAPVTMFAERACDLLLG
ncbi:GMC family oxidoreductase [Nocardia pseudobrasiliensis]|uniref:Choline dehydrogenase n=1 Tax=Nocardia pseudobrasiliensis TaxID=45979 RepID=A0A370I955_9NOCA|nr:GMC family oxidoreductase N-terminal domain-containing protein [Nocardia pseudobrasiliensis]RDI67249.1 choline dehydrogenase [Nocardia pseudobrasiliensis]